MSTRTIRNIFASGVALTLLLTAGFVHAAVQSNPPKPTADECLACHSDASLTHDENGKTVSLHVDPQAFKDSIHGSMFTCVDCHTDVKSAAHETTPKKITCATCHADEQAAYDRSFHARPCRAATLTLPPASIATAARTNCCRPAIRSRASITPTFPQPAARATARNS